MSKQRPMKQPKAKAKAGVAKPAKRAPVARAPAARKKAAAAAGAARSRASGPVSEGMRAPEFELADQTGQRVSSASLAGKPYVLYFYPKDDTAGCTREACDFRDQASRFATRKVRVLGVSPDSVESHQRFRGKYGLDFSLLSDPDKSLARAYGVWVKKLNYGREYMGIARSTFLVDAKGVVLRAWRGVRVPGHVADVLESLAEVS